MLADAKVSEFIGTDDYRAHKDQRFLAADEKDIGSNPAFLLDDAETLGRFERAYEQTRALYYRDQPALKEILKRIAEHSERL